MKAASTLGQSTCRVETRAAGNTGREKEDLRTHVRAKRTESTRVFGYTGASMEVEDERER